MVVFVNDIISAEVIDQLADFGVKLIALRCSGFNNVDLRHAQGKIRIVRVPAYSPNAIAEHTVALMMTLNRRNPKHRPDRQCRKWENHPRGSHAA